MILLLLLLPIKAIRADESKCDVQCQRMLSFISTQMSPIINEIGKVSNINIPITGTLNHQMKLYSMLIAFYSVFFGLNDPKFVEPLDESLGLSMQMELIRTNLKTIYSSLTDGKNPLELFSNFAWAPVNTQDIKKADITFENQTSIPWIINLLPSNTYQTIKPGKNTITIDQPFFRVYLSNQQKKENGNLGTWFFPQKSYPHELYTLKKDNNAFKLHDNSTGEELIAQKTVLAQTVNTL